MNDYDFVDAFVEHEIKMIEEWAYKEPQKGMIAYYNRLLKHYHEGRFTGYEVIRDIVLMHERNSINQTEKASSDMTIWNRDIGLINISEGDGSNLWEEDEKEGYVDYIMIDSDDNKVDGGQLMLTELYQEKFHSDDEVINYCIVTGFIPSADYIVVKRR